MNPEHEQLVRNIATNRLEYASKERTSSQGGQIMDDAKMLAWMVALQTYPEDETEMVRMMNNSTLIEECFDLLTQIYHEQIEK